MLVHVMSYVRNMLHASMGKVWGFPGVWASKGRSAIPQPGIHSRDPQTLHALTTKFHPLFLHVVSFHCYATYYLIPF